MEIVAILDRVGYRGDRETELNSLCNILGRDPQNTKERIERIRTKTGFISSAGRFYYVTPAPVAMIAFESAWQTWASPDPYRFLKSIPEGLVQAFHNRVSSASPEVGAIVGKFFRQWTIGNGSRILESESDTRRLVALVAADPATQVPLLRMLVETANPAQIKGPVSPPFPFGGVTPRRLIVSVAEELAQFRSFFVDAEAILFRFATDETEPSLGNNATKTWMGLFRIVLSETEVPFLQRYEILKKRLVANAPLEKKLVIAAAAAALDRNPYRIVGAPLFGSLVPPKEWHPPTYEDHMNAIRGCLLLLLEGTFDPNAEVSNTAKQALLDGASHLLWGGLVDPVRETLEGRLPDDLRPRLAALVRESYARAISQNAPAGNPETTKALENWLTSLKSDTLHERLIENVAVEPWSHHFEEEQWRNRIAELARDLFEDAQALTRELPWLGSNEAKAAAEIGHYLGLCDQTELRFLDQIIDAAVEHHTDALARGYLFGASQSQQVDSERLNKALDRVQSADPRLAFYIMLPTGDLLHSFDRAIRMVEAGQISPRLLTGLQVWVGNRKTTPEEAARAVRLLLPIVRNGEREAGTTAVDFVASQFYKLDAEGQGFVLTRMLGSGLKSFGLYWKR